MKNFRTVNLHTIDWETEQLFSIAQSTPTALAQRIKKNPTWAAPAQARFVEDITVRIRFGLLSSYYAKLVNELTLAPDHVAQILAALSEAPDTVYINALGFAPYRQSEIAQQRIDDLIRAKDFFQFVRILNYYQECEPEHLTAFVERVATICLEFSPQGQSKIAANLVRSASIKSHDNDHLRVHLSHLGPCSTFFTKILEASYRHLSYISISDAQRLFVWDLTPPIARLSITPLLTGTSIDLDHLDAALATMYAPSWKTFYTQLSSSELAHLLSVASPPVRLALLGLVSQHARNAL